MTSSTTRTSAEETIERFDTPAAATKYAGSLGGTATDRREVACILNALREVRSGGQVLDLPCGTGRLLAALHERGVVVTEADSSPHMVNLAREHARQMKIGIDDSRFVVASVFATPFANDQFDAVVCNRLIHHFREPEVRRRALTELGRISRGPIVVSFFCNLALDAAVFHVKDALRRKKASDRIPINRAALAEDAKTSGLIVRRWLATRPGISKQWYAVMERR